MRFKVPTLFAAVFGLLLFAVFANASSIDRDVGIQKIIVKAKASGNDLCYQLSVAAHEPAPAWIRHKFEFGPLPRDNERQRPAIWNDRICHNYPFQIPGKAGPPSIRHVLRE